MKPKLTVITTHFNYCDYTSRHQLYRQFAEHMAHFDVRLVTVECAFGKRPHVVTQANHPDHLQVRAEQPLWVKENLLNLGFRYAIATDPLVEQFAWLDADIAFQNPHWVEETQDMLMRVKVIQPWKRVVCLGKDGNVEQDRLSWGFKHMVEGAIGHSGYGWAIRRHTWEQLGGFLDLTIAGGGDFFFARAITGDSTNSRGGNVSPEAKEIMDTWSLNAAKLIDKKFGFIEGDITHFYHGSFANREYGKRYQFLQQTKFNPTRDLVYNQDGVVQLKGQQKLVKLLHEYFQNRKEDDGLGTN